MSNITDKVSRQSFEAGLSMVNSQMSSTQIDDMIKVPWLQEEGVKESVCFYSLFLVCLMHMSNLAGDI